MRSHHRLSVCNTCFPARDHFRTIVKPLARRSRKTNYEEAFLSVQTFFKSERTYSAEKYLETHSSVPWRTILQNLGQLCPRWPPQRKRTVCFIFAFVPEMLVQATAKNGFKFSQNTLYTFSSLLNLHTQASPVSFVASTPEPQLATAMKLHPSTAIWSTLKSGLCFSFRSYRRFSCHVQLSKGNEECEERKKILTVFPFPCRSSKKKKKKSKLWMFWSLTLWYWR